MSIEAVMPITAPSSVASPQLSAVSNDDASTAVDFGRWMGEQVSSMNQQITGAEQSLVQLASGQSGNLHEVMLDLEQARQAFQLTVQVRNRLMEAYQELMKMQI